MTTTSEEAELLEAIRAAKEMQEKINVMVKGFPPDGKELADNMRAAANRTVENLELALEAWRKDARLMN